MAFSCFRKDPYCARPFEGLKIIDVGCGGGILSEVLFNYYLEQWQASHIKQFCF